MVQFISRHTSLKFTHKIKLLHPLILQAQIFARTHPLTGRLSPPQLNRIIVFCMPVSFKSKISTKIQKYVVLCTILVHFRSVYSVNTRVACTILVHTILVICSNLAIFWRQQLTIRQQLHLVAILKNNSSIFRPTIENDSQQSEVDQLSSGPISASLGSAICINFDCHLQRETCKL